MASQLISPLLNSDAVNAGAGYAKLQVVLEAAAQIKLVEDRMGRRFFQASLDLSVVLCRPAEYGQKSVGYKGTGTRLRRVLRKVARGEPLKISAIGGSSMTAPPP
jgi:hypothetical protein